jgi:hypothetical protein
MTIQPTPYLSCTTPKQGEKKVFPSGIWTWPPSERALKNFFACASSEALRESEKPEKPLFPVGTHQDRFPDLDGAVHDLVFVHLRTAFTGLRAVLEAHQHLDFAVQRLAVEIQGFFAAAAELQVGLDLGSNKCRIHFFSG